MHQHQRGLTYAEVLVAAALLVGIVGSLVAGLSHGMRLSEMAKVRTALLNAAQDQIEQIRGRRFENVQGSVVTVGEMTGNVTVEPLSARRKRVSVRLTHAQFPSQPIGLVTYVHLNGLNDGLTP